MQFNVNNKTTINKICSFCFCRHCDDNYYDNVCFNQKIMLTKIKNENNEKFNRINLNNFNLNILNALKTIQKNQIND